MLSKFFDWLKHEEKEQLFNVNNITDKINLVSHKLETLNYSHIEYERKNNQNKLKNIIEEIKTLSKIQEHMVDESDTDEINDGQLVSIETSNKKY